MASVARDVSKMVTGIGWLSPIGVGLFLISAGFTVWLLSQSFGWN